MFIFNEHKEIMNDNLTPDRASVSLEFSISPLYPERESGERRLRGV